MADIPSGSRWSMQGKIFHYYRAGLKERTFDSSWVLGRGGLDSWISRTLLQVFSLHVTPAGVEGSNKAPSTLSLASLDGAPAVNHVLHSCFHSSSPGRLQLTTLPLNPLGSSGLQLWSWHPCAVHARFSTIASWWWWSPYPLAGTVWVMVGDGSRLEDASYRRYAQIKVEARIHADTTHAHEHTYYAPTLSNTQILLWMIKVQIHNGIHCINNVPVVQFCWAAHDNKTCIHKRKCWESWSGLRGRESV